MKIKNIFLVAATALALTACSSDDEQQRSVSQLPADGVMRFTTNLNDATALTRASMTTDNLASFKVKIVNAASTTYSYFETVNKSGTEWLPANRMLWQNSTQAISMTAAALGSHTFTDAEFTAADGINLTVASDQSTEAKLNAEDLLTMPTKTINNPSTETTLLSDGKLVVNLYHGLTKLNVELDLASEFNNLTKADLTDMTISGTNLSYNFKPMATANTNYGTVTVKADTKGDITPFQSAFTAATTTDSHSYATYEAIVVPQSIAAGKLTVSFNVNGKPFSWTNTEVITLEQGKEYTQPIKVGEDQSLAPRALIVEDW